MPSAEENMNLLWLIIQQKLDSGILTGIDWTTIATSLGLEQPTAASLRWSRLKKELSESGLAPRPTGEGTPKKTKKAANPKSKKQVDENGEDGVDKKPVQKRGPKKRKIEEVEDAIEHEDAVVKSEAESREIEEEA